jgi:AraC-like DNA-binding protein
MTDPAIDAAPPVSSYREWRPGPALAAHVLCFWSQVIGDGHGSHPQRVLPDGCADIVWIGEMPAVVAGPATRTVIAELPARSIVIGVRFHPGAAPCLLKVPASELLDRETPLREIWGPGADELFERIGAATGLAAKLAVAGSALAARTPAAAACDPLVAAAVRWLARHPAGRVERLGTLLGIGERQLRRRFRTSVGYGPKTLQRVLRLQRLLALAGRGPARPPLAALAADAGYADQAHMTRELGALAERTPGTLLGRPRSTLEMSDLFKTAVDAAPTFPRTGRWTRGEEPWSNVSAS